MIMTPEIEDMLRILSKGNEDIQYLVKRVGDKLVVINRGNIMKSSLHYYGKWNTTYYLVFYCCGIRVLVNHSNDPKD